MSTFCSDVDLLRWEPTLFRDAGFVSQTLMNGTGAISGATLTIAAGSFTAARVESGGVVTLGAPHDGCLAILSVDSATQLTLSPLAPGIDDEPPLAGLPPSGVDLPFTIRTFWAQRRLVSDLIRACALVEESIDAGAPAVVQAPGVRRACALGALQMIYNALAAPGDTPHHAVHADLYERLFRQAVRRARVQIDTDGDGQPDLVRRMDVLRLERA